MYRRRDVQVPAGLGRDDLIAWSGDQAVAAGRRMRVVLGPEDCVYLEPDGCSRPSTEPPRGGAVVGAEEGEGLDGV